MGSNPRDEEEELFERLRAYERSKGRAALRRIVGEILREPPPEQVEGESFLSAAKRLGAVGCFDGPPDLSTNPDHMEGFGES